MQVATEIAVFNSPFISETVRDRSIVAMER